MLALRAAQVEAKCVELRLAGKTYLEIGVEVGHNASFVMKILRRVYHRLTNEGKQDAIHLRGLEIARLDALQSNLWARAMKGDLQFVDRVLRIIEQRTSLLGLNSPEVIAFHAQINVQKPADLTDEQLVQIIETFRTTQQLASSQKPLLPSVPMVVDAKSGLVVEAEEEAENVTDFTDEELEVIARKMEREEAASLAVSPSTSAPEEKKDVV